MARLQLLFCVGLLFVGGCLPIGSLRAQDAGSQAGQLWKDAQSAFGAGDYAKSATALEAIIKASGATIVWGNQAVVPPAPPNRQWLEPVFFMLGAAHYNAKDWPNAILVFT